METALKKAKALNGGEWLIKERKRSFAKGINRTIECAKLNVDVLCD